MRKNWIVGCSCSALVVALVGAALVQGGNPTVPQGGSATFPATGNEGAGNGLVWDVLNSSGSTQGTNASPNGWSVTLSGGSFTVGAPANAPIGTNYKVRQTVEGAGEGPDLDKSALFDVVAPLPAAPTNLTAKHGDHQDCGSVQNSI